MNKKSIELSKEQRAELEEVIKKGKAPVRKILHAQVRLKIDSGQDGFNWPDEQIQEAFGVSAPTVWRIRRRFLEHGLDEALNRRRQPERPEKRILDGEKEAYLIALICAEKPEGEGEWSLRLLSQRLVKLGYVERVSHETVRQALKKINSSHG